MEAKLTQLARRLHPSGPCAVLVPMPTPPPDAHARRLCERGGDEWGSRPELWALPLGAPACVGPATQWAEQMDPLVPWGSWVSNAASIMSFHQTDFRDSSSALLPFSPALEMEWGC